ncbi:MAG: hypothetical protein RLZZ416_98 [Candidatus Parcubacteria bacterium]|jgi:phosphoribosylglycinamide formyltransferase-1
MEKPKIIVFASGTKDGGGSGFENLVDATKTGVLDADILAVVSNHEHGGVRERAKRLGVSFIYFPGPYEADDYRRIMQRTGAEWAVLSGWLRLVKGLNPAKTVNIHPSLFSQRKFHGPGMYGKKVHDAVAAALERGEINEIGCTIHFVTSEMDEGPAIFEYRVPVKANMSGAEVESAVRAIERKWEPIIVNQVVHGEIRWDGKDRKSLVVPPNFK